MNDKYSNMLCHPNWFRKRVQVLNRDGKKCRHCGRKTNLNVHHKQYHTRRASGKQIEPWNYKLKYLVTLCRDCHSNGHNKFNVPVFKI